MQKHKKRPAEWSAWGPWLWSTTYSRYYRQRQDRNGNVETLWADEQQNEANEQAQEPRIDADDLADDVANVNIGDDDDGDEKNYKFTAGKSSRPSSTKYQKSSTRSSGSSKGKSSSESKGKGRYDPEEVPEEDEPDDQGDYYERGGNNKSPTYATHETAYGSYDQDPEAEHAYTSTGYSTKGGRGYQYGQDSYEEEGYSGAGYGDPPDDGNDDTYYPPSSRDKEKKRQGHSKYIPDEDEGSEGNVTPRGGGGSGKFDISGTPGDVDLDSRYRVEPSWRFQPGEVFKVLWPEPSGAALGGTPTISDRQKIPNGYGGTFYAGFRRFVVIANDSGHCTCVPILTYGGKACKKRGVKPEKHGIITELGQKAKRLDGEPPLGFPPVRMQMRVDGEWLVKESRINYSKFVTVEHNVKVLFIGSILHEDYELVVDATDACWGAKRRHRQKKDRR